MEDLLERVERELITFILITYNQEEFIREAIEGAIAQTYEPLEIVISDDHSSDATYEIITEMVGDYKGPHSVVVNRNPKNLGICGNVNRALSLASGSIIVIAGGDDISNPERTEESWKVLAEHPGVVCVSLGLRVIDAAGNPIRDERAMPGDPVSFHTLADFIDVGGFQHPGASRAFRRSVYDFYGPLADDAQTEDSTTLLRCLLDGSVCLSESVAVQYRIHGDNYSLFAQGSRIDRAKIHRQYLRDATRALEAGKIAPQAHRDLVRGLARRLARTTVHQGWQKANVKTVYALTRVLPVHAFTPHEKLGFLLRSARADARRVLSRPK